MIARQKKSDNKGQNVELDDTKSDKKSPLGLKEQDNKAKEEAKALKDSNKPGKSSLLDGKVIPKGALKSMKDALGQEEVEIEDKSKFPLDFNIDSIKSRYLYPFNATKQKSIDLTS